MAAIPFNIGEYKVVAGIGAVEYANMNYYFQDNNVLSPAVNIQRPFPVHLVTNDSLPLAVQWYQNIRNREGSIYGYGAALSVGVTENLSFGLSGMLIKGSTNDFESQIGRGTLVFYSQYFRVDSVNYKNANTGTSDYTGAEFNISGSYKSGNLTLGFSIKPPTSITRKFNFTYQNDTLNVSNSLLSADLIK